MLLARVGSQGAQCGAASAASNSCSCYSTTTEQDRTSPQTASHPRRDPSRVRTSEEPKKWASCWPFNSTPPLLFLPRRLKTVGDWRSICGAVLLKDWEDWNADSVIWWWWRHSNEIKRWFPRALCGFGVGRKTLVKTGKKRWPSWAEFPPVKPQQTIILWLVWDNIWGKLHTFKEFLVLIKTLNIRTGFKTWHRFLITVSELQKTSPGLTKSKITEFKFLDLFVFI